MVGYHELAWRIPRFCFWFMVGISKSAYKAWESQRCHFISTAIGDRLLVLNKHPVHSIYLHVSASLSESVVSRNC